MTAPQPATPGNDSVHEEIAKVLREDGASLIAAERRRQVEAEGWTPEHDSEHAGESLALAACCYALPPQMRKYKRVLGPDDFVRPSISVPTLWPWEGAAWKPRDDDRIRELVKAGALIAAEIDRLRDRAAAYRTNPSSEETHRG